MNRHSKNLNYFGCIRFTLFTTTKIAMYVTLFIVNVTNLIDYIFSNLYFYLSKYLN